MTSPVPAHPALCGHSPERLVAVVDEAVCPHRLALDRPGKAPAGVVAAGARQYSERMTPDGTIGLQPVVPLVSRPGLDAPVWDVTVFTKNGDRLLEGEVAMAFF